MADEMYNVKASLAQKMACMSDAKRTYNACCHASASTKKNICQAV